uniref:Uncharacterized protein n=1 Tax=Avena sativa TaxID=4498 RepID=A0ACD5X9T0_AVESA
MASTEESSSSSFRTPGSVPFKWELRPGIPKEPEDRGTDLPAPASSSLQLPPRLAMPPAGAAAAATVSPSLQLPPRLQPPPSGASSSRKASSGGVRAFASVSSMRRSCTPVPSMGTTPRHRRSMSARFATSLALPFTGPRWRGRSKDEDDVAFAAIYGDKIVS